MSTVHAKAEIVRFFESDEPEVLCLRGAWGVGKTFALREAVRDLSDLQKISLTRYSYVSLFGLDTLDKVRQSIFDNTVKSDGVNRPDDGSSIFRAFSDLEALARKAKGLQSLLPGSWGGSGAAAFLDRAAFSSVRNQIICFDDLERTSSSLSVRDILGLSTFLKEERDCKVILVLNDQKLKDNNKRDFNSQFEKVVDSSIMFDPSIDETLDIVLNEDFAEADYFREVIKKIGIKNIRVVTKILRIVQMIVDECGTSSSDLRQVISTAALAGWVKFEGGDDVNLDELKSFNSIALQVGSQRNDAEPLPEWIERPNALSYSHSDQVDIVIIDAMERGYINPEQFNAAVSKRDDESSSNENNEEFSEAWKLYHGSLNISDEKIVSELLSGMRANYKGVSLLNFNGTVSLFRELGFDDQANIAIKEYFEIKDLDRFALRDDLAMWGKEKIDPGIEKHFDRLIADFVDDRDPLAVLVEAAERISWGDSDIELLSSLKKQELVANLDKVPNESLTRVLKFLLRFVGSSEPQYKDLGILIKEAFEEISSRSSNNMRKLRSLGFEPSAPP